MLRTFKKIFGATSSGSRPAQGSGASPDEKLEPQITEYLAAQSIAGALLDGRPFLAGRLGFTEAFCLDQFLARGEADDALMNRIRQYSGVYPTNPDEFARFAESYLEAIGQIDLLGIMNAPGEAGLVRKYGGNPLLAALSTLEPYYWPCPWSRYLAGRKILVIHPFIDSIRHQFERNRHRLFANPDVLPDFDLKLVRAPITIEGNEGSFKSWSETFEDMKRQVSATDFDAAIVGCGAYGLPIGAHIKSLGKACVQLGGATQILFGVMGARWQDQPYIRSLQTAAWIRPLDSERPPTWQALEGGCYW